MRATAVIGANFGDEGKGLITDYVVSRLRGDVVVVRFNGGAQAGHTVVTPTGVRHVFHHFGSGSLLGAATYLSRFFVVNPLLWRLEAWDLQAIGGNSTPNAFVDPRAALTTPYDMLINQEIERIRGSNRHGSCGAGVNETLVRNQTEFATRAELSNLKATCKLIRDRWVAQRLAALTPEKPSEQFLERVWSDTLLDNYLNDAEAFLRWTPRIKRIPAAGHVVFEGAQGLLLDEDHRYFPYVTHSKTGLHNVVQLCRESGIDQLDAIYVTRAYMTRHGAGPFPTENTSLSYADPTNVPNAFQGALRFGDLDPVALREAMAADLATSGTLPVAASVAVTCLDQVADPIGAYELLRPHVPVAYVSYGPTRSDVHSAQRDLALDLSASL